MPIKRGGMQKVSGATENAPAVFNTAGQVKDPDTNIDFKSKQALSFIIENRTGDPDSPIAGQIWLRTDL